MFRSNTKEKQQDLFSSLFSQLSGKSNDIYTNPLGWHNVFRTHYFEKIDENIFSVLYNDQKGCPNAPVNTIISMMILKEGFGWSDERLFEEFRFNVLVRASVGIFDFRESIPSESTYYLFKKRILAHEQEIGEDLISKVFGQLTHNHVISFNVNGSQVRMDSKLIGANLARLSRFGLVHKAVQMFCRELVPEQIAGLPQDIQTFIKTVLGEEQEKIVYKSTNKEINEKLEWLGINIFHLLSCFKEFNTQTYSILEQVFSEQFDHIEEKNIKPKPKEGLKASNIQTPYDPDAGYRKKGDTIVYGGYSANATETCSEGGGLDLITATEVNPATAADNNFYRSGIEKSMSVTKEEVKKVFTDGAYNSAENREFNQDKDIDHVLTGLQGAGGRYSFETTGTIETIKVIDNQAGETSEASITGQGKSYKFTNSIGKTCYIPKEQVENFYHRQQMETRDWQEKKRRNNVEATIFQLFYFTRNNKLRYRGLQKIKTWLFCRSLWVNCVRIKNYLTENIFNDANRTSTFVCFYKLILLIYVLIENLFNLIFYFSRYPPEIVTEKITGKNIFSLKIFNSQRV